MKRDKEGHGDVFTLAMFICLPVAAFALLLAACSGGAPLVSAVSVTPAPIATVTATSVVIQSVTPTPPVPVSPTPTPGPGNPARGQTLFTDIGCAGCHVFGPYPRPQALASVSPATIMRVVRFGQAAMPAFSESEVSNQDLADIIAYLESVRTVSPTPAISPTVTPSPSATAVVGNAAAGQQLFTTKGCAGCHIQGVAPNPSVLATLSPSQITSIVRSGLDGMPAYSESALSNQNLTDIIAWIQTQ